MILVDSNILLYATLTFSPLHVRAKSWFESQLRGDVRIGLPWSSLLAFVRISGNRHILEKPLTVQQSWSLVESWLALDGVWIPEPTDRHLTLLREFIPLCSGSSRLIHDADLAALAIEHGLTLCSGDADFARFPGLQWENPFVPGPG